MLRALQNIRIGLFISLVNLLIQGVSFLVNNFIAKNLGTVDYGAFTVLQGDYGIFCALADFGMATLILAFFGKRASEGRLFTNVLQLRLLCSVTTMLIMLAFAFTVRRNHPAFQGELILALGLLFQHAFFDWYFICGNLWKTLLISKLLHTLSYSTVMGIALLGLKIHSIGGIALAMVLAALPAWGFGVRKAFTPKILHFTRRSFRFFALMLRNGVPYALASLASFAYLPAGLYAVDKFAPPEFLGAYSFGHKLILLASGFMVYFISSNLIVLHRETSAKDGKVHSKDIIIFTLFIAAASSPLWICPGLILKILFFAFP
ncbi:MAG: oligosaccharide flippase family protein, partial [Fibrobacteraceae bacterium]